MVNGGAMTSIQHALHPEFTARETNSSIPHTLAGGLVMRKRAIVILCVLRVPKNVSLLVTKRNVNGNMVEKSNAKVHVINIRKKLVLRHVVVNILTAVNLNRIVFAKNFQRDLNAFPNAKTAHDLVMEVVISSANLQQS
jgi:hypothetical protein